MTNDVSMFVRQTSILIKLSLCACVGGFKRNESFSRNICHLITWKWLIFVIFRLFRLQNLEDEIKLYRHLNMSFELIEIKENGARLSLDLDWRSLKKLFSIFFCQLKKIKIKVLKSVQKNNSRIQIRYNYYKKINYSKR